VTAVSDGLSGVLKRGAAMAAVGVVISQVVTIVQTIALGRILGPAEIGVFTAGSVLVGFFAAFAQGALSQALIHRETDIEDAAHTALIVTFGAGLLLGVLLLSVSPLVGAIFDSPRIGLIAAATSGIMVLHTWASVPDALMQRAFHFKRQMVIAPAVSTVFASVSIAFAYHGFGAWSMVNGWYASSVTAVVLSWSMARWRPFRGRFSAPLWREMATYSLPMLLGDFAQQLREAGEQVIVGRGLGTADLGHYRYAYRLASLPSVMVISVCAHVLFPAFSRISGDSARFRVAFLRALGWIWWATLPVAALLVLEGRAIVVLLLGDQWEDAGSAAAMMAGIGLGTALMSVAAEAMKGAGRSSRLNWMTVVSLGVGLPLVVLLLPAGLDGVGLAISLTYLVVGFLSVGLARNVVGVSWREVLGRLGPPALSAMVAVCVLVLIDRLFIQPGQYQGIVGMVWVLVTCLLFFVVYIGALRLISPSWYKSVKSAAVGAAAQASGRVRKLVGSR
jgi:O-antigen/teichoic acid export membrane protein